MKEAIEAFLDAHCVHLMVFSLIIIYHGIASWFVWNTTKRAIFEFIKQHSKFPVSIVEQKAEYYCFMYLSQFTLFPIPIISHFITKVVRVWKRRSKKEKRKNDT